MTTFSLFIAGTPAKKGSTKSIPFQHAHGPKKGRLGTRTMNADKKGPQWEALVQLAVAEHLAKTGLIVPFSAPVRLDVEFRFHRPNYHYRSGRYERELKPYYNFAHHVTTPDRDKLLRCLTDGMTHVAYADDNQVCAGETTKVYVDRWTQPEGAMLTVTYLTEASDGR